MGAHASKKQDGPKEYGVRHIIEHCNTARHVVLSHVPAGIVTIYGEILSIYRSKELSYLTLRDASVDNMIMEASLPLDRSTGLRKGDMIAISGSFQPRLVRSSARITVFFAGFVAFSKGTSSRYNRRLAKFTALKNTFNHPIKVKYPLDNLALVAPAGSLGAEDFLRALQPDKKRIQVDVCYATFSNPSQLAGAIENAFRAGRLVVIARGGGDALAMDIFNDENVVEAIYKCAIQCPVVLAVGHCSDEPLAARFASNSYGTPSIAGKALGSKHQWKQDEERRQMAQQQEEARVEADRKRTQAERDIRRKEKERKATEERQRQKYLEQERIRRERSIGNKIRRFFLGMRQWPAICVGALSALAGYNINWYGTSDQWDHGLKMLRRLAEYAVNTIIICLILGIIVICGSAGNKSRKY